MNAFSEVRRAAPALLAGTVLLGLLFHAEIDAAVQVWMGSTAYNYCFLILPVAGWLVWERRGLLVGLPLRPSVRALPAGLALGFIWLVADRLGIMEGRQLAAMGLVQLLFFSVLGWPLYRRLAAPLLYLFFLVPVGAFLVPALQTFTTQFVAVGLTILDIPHYVSGNVVEIAAGAFHIARACAGLRFLIAAAAFSVFYALVIYRSWQRRLLFVAIALFVPVIANGFRALGIVWLGHILGSAQAAAVDHVLYGYIFFSIVLLLLILLGLLFRQDREGASVAFAINALRREAGSSVSVARLMVPCAAIVVIAALGPLATFAADRAAVAEPVSAPKVVAGCVASEAGPAPELVRDAGGVMARFSCANRDIVVDFAIFPPRTDPRPIFDTERLLIGENTPESMLRQLIVPTASPRIWKVVVTPPPVRVTAGAVWMGGKPVGDGVRARLGQALRALRGTKFAPVAVAVRATVPPALAAGVLRSFLGGDVLSRETMQRLSEAAKD